METPKIELSLRSIFEQRMFYPLYPPNLETPVEYDQIENLYLSETPDILISPSDLTHFIKVIQNMLINNQYRTLTDAYVSTQEPSLRVMQVAPLAQCILTNLMFMAS